MGLGDIIRRTVAPRTSARIDATTTIVLWWGTTEAAAARIDADGEAVPVLFHSWPIQSTAGHTDAEIFTQVTAALKASPKTVRLLVALPIAWGPARRAAWHRAAVAAGYTDPIMVAAARVLATAGGITGETAPRVWIAVAADRGTIQATACRTNTDGDVEVLSHHAKVPDSTAAADGIPRLIVDVLTAAEIPGPPDRVIVAGPPETTGRLAAGLRDATDADVRVVTPVDLAQAIPPAAIAAESLAPEPVPGPPRTGILATVLCGVLGLLVAAWVIADALPGYTPTGAAVAVFSPGHLAVAAFALATTGVAAGMLIVHARLVALGSWDWATAGTWLIAGTAAGLAAAGTAGLSLAAIKAVPAGPPLAWAVVPAIPVLAAYSCIGALLRAKPEPAPLVRIWPPIGAVTLAAVGILVVRSAEPIWAGMPTSAALTARAGLIVIAAATAWAATPKPPVAIGIAAVLAIAYTLTASPATGTTACLLFIAAATIRAGTALAGLARDRRVTRAPRSLLTGPTRLAPRT